MARRRSVGVRFAVPFMVAGAIALGTAVPSLSSAAAPPKLPDITLAQLITKAESPQVGAWDGTVRWTAALGLPDLSELGLGGGSAADFDWTSLTAGTHGVKVWVDGSGRRVALIGSSSEIDLYSDGASTWEYDSVTNTATHLVGAARTPTGPASPAGLSPQSLSPQGIGEQLLQGVETWTDAQFDPAATVAGQPAYVVSLTPRPGAPGAPATTLGRLTVAVDAANGMILRVGVYAAGSSDPAFVVGFHTVDFLPAGRHLPTSEFAFSPGPGVKVVERTETQEAMARGATTGQSGTGADALSVEGTGWSQVVVIPGALGHLGADGTGPPAGPPAGAGRKHSAHHPRARGLSNDLDEVTTSVHGSWGTGRLLATNLLNALILPDGEVIAGFVTPGTLEAAAAAAG